MPEWVLQAQGMGPSLWPCRQCLTPYPLSACGFSASDRSRDLSTSGGGDLISTGPSTVQCAGRWDGDGTGADWRNCDARGGVSVRSALAISGCARRSRGPKQPTLRRKFTSACRPEEARKWLRPPAFNDLYSTVRHVETVVRPVKHRSSLLSETPKRQKQRSAATEVEFRLRKA